MTYFQDEDGTRTPLPAQNIDTGAGLERLAWVLQDVRSVYETDELREHRRTVASNVAGRPYDPVEAPEVARALRSITEHSRAFAFLVNDGVLPGERGPRLCVASRAAARGLLRPHHRPARAVPRAHRRRRHRGIARATIRSSPASATFIRRVAGTEEARFQATLARGLELLDEVLGARAASKRIPGRDMFVLYDTHGLPPELTLEVAAPHGYEVDARASSAEMAAQRVRSRAARPPMRRATTTLRQRYAPLGLDTRLRRVRGVAGAVHGGRRDSSGANASSDSRPGRAARCVLAATSFYPEGGGQVGRPRRDRYARRALPRRRHAASTATSSCTWVRSPKAPSPLGEAAESRVDPEWRAGSQRNHTATHLLHAALRRHLGSHVRQAGSYVGPDRLRFDYTHPEAPSAEELRAVQRAGERARARRHRAARPSSCRTRRRSSAARIAFFEDRYTADVRMVEYCEAFGHNPAHRHTAECYSRELCGGTHLHSTGQVGLFQIVSDTSIGAGLRRIEAVTGPEAERTRRGALGRRK